MTVGRFNLKVDNAPLAMRQSIRLGTNVFITASHIKDPTLDVAGLAATAKYSGLIRRVNVADGSFSGSNLLAYLQTGKGHGGAGHPLGEPTTYPCEFDDVMAAWFDGVYSNGLLEGTNVGHVTTQIAALDMASYLPPFKPALDNLAKQTGNEYVCRPDGTVDYGLNQLLFRFTSPIAMVAPGLSGQDDGLTALELDSWSVTQSIENQRNYAAGITSDLVTASTMLPAPTSTFTTYRWDDIVNPCVYYTDGFQSIDTTNSSDLDNAVEALAQEFEGIEYFFECSVDEYCIPRLITPGDWVYVYDPDNGIGGGTQVTFQGRSVFPEKFRCVGTTWPVQKGMGVYVGNDVYGITDITDFVRWETGATRLDIDSLPRALQVSFPTSAKYK